jgi:hypothetical protein
MLQCPDRLLINNTLSTVGPFSIISNLLTDLFVARLMNACAQILLKIPLNYNVISNLELLGF